MMLGQAYRCHCHAFHSRHPSLMIIHLLLRVATSLRDLTGRRDGKTNDRNRLQLEQAPALEAGGEDVPESVRGSRRAGGAGDGVGETRGAHGAASNSPAQRNPWRRFKGGHRVSWTPFSLSLSLSRTDWRDGWLRGLQHPPMYFPCNVGRSSCKHSVKRVATQGPRHSSFGSNPVPHL